MTERPMLSKEAFIDFILRGPDTQVAAAELPSEPAVPEDWEVFSDAEAQPSQMQLGPRFARWLMEGCFGNAALLQRDNVIRSTDAVARYLPDRVAHWPKTPSRPYQTLLFEAELSSKQLLGIPTFKSHRISHLEDVESALARMVAEALEGFQRGGEGVTADVRKGRKEETLCIVSIVDERNGQPARLVCFGTQNKSSGGLETFQITEQTRYWDTQLARDYLGLLYERQFKKLEGQDWQEAFTTTEERSQAQRLLTICTHAAPSERDIQEGVLDLLDIIAKSFGLRKKAGAGRRLQAFDLPADHDIGIDPEERQASYAGKNPFSGVTLRDEKSRLLGYIVYPLKARSDATRLRRHLEANNRFHNVLVVYPDQDHASLELWQGREQLTGKLRKGQGYRDAADVVNLLSRFFVVSKAKVRNPTELAQELAYRARYLRRLAVKQLEDEPEKGPLRNLYDAFKEALVHDQTEDEFADAFAQTITYGLLTARWTGNDQLMADGERFTRQTALKYLPAASPFLNDLFKSALSVKLDEQRGRLLWLVDDIADLLDRIDVAYVFGAGDKDSDTATDPVIHFYEPFLSAYDKELKNKRGVFFTPRPVVSYIVRSVHELLQTEFGLQDGLASTDTWGDVANRIGGLRIPEGKEVADPFVCILDIATGTGTFLYECIEVIERTMKDRWCRELKKTEWTDPAVAARWRDFVPNHLLPRLCGYELMMASYAIAHLKLFFKLRETGYCLGEKQRLNVYLTNSLEPPSDSGQQKLASMFPALAHEAEAVSEVKRHTRFTVVIGNPPYAGHSANDGDWISNLVDTYYFVDGRPLGERTAKWLQDDYVKFFRFGQLCVSMAGAGILGYITNHGYLDNPTFRGMRFSLLRQFGSMRILDLHGNLKKKERTATGGPDENVFDIQPGVAICLLGLQGLGTGKRLHSDLFGVRSEKYHALIESSASSTNWTPFQPSAPFFVLYPQDVGLRDEFASFWKSTDVFPVNGVGMTTARDHVVIDFDRQPLLQRATLFRDSTAGDSELCRLMEIPEKKGWSVSAARKLIRAERDLGRNIRGVAYRPFDDRLIFYHDSLVWRTVRAVMRHMLSGSNLGLAVGRAGQVVDQGEWNLVYATRQITEFNLFRRGGNNLAPLYVFTQPGELGLSKQSVPNFAPAFLRELAEGLSLRQVKPHQLPEGVEPEDIFHYAYAVFYSPGYRRRYQEFLRIDFPRLPLIGSIALFRELVSLGSKLVALHLLEYPGLKTGAAEFIGACHPEIEKVSWSKNTAWVDRAQTTGFKGVREDIWSFQIGGYQVCEKWLKDRKGRTLSREDIEHYQKIIIALSETIRLMKEVDRVIDKHGGWPGAFVTKADGGRK